MQFLDISVSFLKFSDNFGTVQTRSELFGRIWIRSDAFGCVRKCLTVFGKIQFFIENHDFVLRLRLKAKDPYALDMTLVSRQSCLNSCVFRSLRRTKSSLSSLLFVAIGSGTYVLESLAGRRGMVLCVALWVLGVPLFLETFETKKN